LVLLSTSRRRERISETREACNVGVNLRGSNGDITSSSAISSKSLRPSGEEIWFGREIGEDAGPGEESARACIEGGRLGVVDGVGKALAAGGLWYIASVAMMPAARPSEVLSPRSRLSVVDFHIHSAELAYYGASIDVCCFSRKANGEEAVANKTDKR
jgi:hypothetical protein